ncbi:hypothetical protein FOH38_23700 [Lysinibacillus fusiformis]|nr:hypothetical protein FOH38_23700 [Lysinibacillus fusiformis]
MHFVQINKTKWRWTGEGPRNPASGKRRQITRRGKSKGEARGKVEKAIAELKKAYTFDVKVTFEEFSQDWLKLYRMKGNKETTNEHLAYCISLLNRYLAKKKMAAITTIEIQGTLNHLFENGTAFFTLRGTHNAAKMMFAYAKEIGLIEVNPVEASFIPMKKLTLVNLWTLDVHLIIGKIAKNKKDLNGLFCVVNFSFLIIGLISIYILSNIYIIFQKCCFIDSYLNFLTYNQKSQILLYKYYLLKKLDK